TSVRWGPLWNPYGHSRGEVPSPSCRRPLRLSPGSGGLSSACRRPRRGDRQWWCRLLSHSDLLRGLVWCTSLVDEDRLTSQVGDAAEICFKKIPNVGPRAPKIGNACLAESRTDI